MFNVRHLEPLRGFPISAFQFFSIFSHHSNIERSEIPSRNAGGTREACRDSNTPTLQHSNTPPQVSALKPQVSPPLSIPP